MSTKLIYVDKPFIGGLAPVTPSSMVGYHMITGEFEPMPNGDMAISNADGTFVIKEHNILFYVEYSDAATVASGAGIYSL